MRSAKIKEERLKAMIGLAPEENPKMYENVLELAELLDALGRSEEADLYYTLGMANKAKWKQAAQETKQNRSTNNVEAGQSAHTTSSAAQKEPTNEGTRSQRPRMKTVLNGNMPHALDSSAQQRTGNSLTALVSGRATNNDAQPAAKPVKEPVAPYRPKPLRTASSGLDGSSAGDVGALQKRSFQGSSSAVSRRQDLQLANGPEHEIPRPESSQEVQTKLQGLNLKESLQESKSKGSAKTSSSPSEPAKKRPTQQLFRPRGQIEAEAKKAEQRRVREQEEEKLAKEKEVKDAEAAAAAMKRQEALRRSAHSQGQSPARPISKTTSFPWSSGREDSHSDWRSARPLAPERETEEISSLPLEGRHVLEVMGIKSTDREADIEAYLKNIHDFGIVPQLRWADGTHALAVFADLLSARIALQKAPEEGRLWLKPYEQASQTCKQIAYSELQPPSVRPQTTDIVVRRILGHALQKSDLRNLEGEKDLRAQRKEKLAKREEKQQLIDSAWGD